MDITQVLGYVVLILFIISVYILPKTVAEYRGVYKEEPNPFTGKLEPDCEWVHSISFGSGVIGLLILFPLLIFLYESIYDYFGIEISIVFLVLVLAILTYYIIKTSKVNSEIALKKNIEESKNLDKELEIIKQDDS